MRRHRCDLRPVDVQPLELLPAGVLWGKAVPRTIVLRRCAGCGNLDTLTLDGAWSIEQCRGQTLSATALPSAAAPGGGHVYAPPPEQIEIIPLEPKAGPS